MFALSIHVVFDMFYWWAFNATYRFQEYAGLFFMWNIYKNGKILAFETQWKSTFFPWFKTSRTYKGRDCRIVIMFQMKTGWRQELPCILVCLVCASVTYGMSVDFSRLRKPYLLSKREDSCKCLYGFNAWLI